MSDEFSDCKMFVENSQILGLMFNNYKNHHIIISTFFNDIDKDIKLLLDDPSQKIDIVENIRKFKKDIAINKSPDEIDMDDIVNSRKRIITFSKELDTLLDRLSSLKNKMAFGGNYYRAIIRKPKVYSKEVSEEKYDIINSNIRNINRGLDWIEKIIIDLYNLVDRDLNILMVVKRVYVDNKIYESTDINDDEVIYEKAIECIQDIDNFLLEASHGKLKSSFRRVVNVDNGHIIKIVFDLKSENITQAGPHYNLSPLDVVSKITKSGHNNFASRGTVKAIVDLDTGKRLNSVTAVGILGFFKNGDPDNNAIKKAGTQFYIPDEFQGKVSSDEFEQCNVTEREKIAKKIGHTIKGITYTVSKMEKVPTYKATSGKVVSDNGNTTGKLGLWSAEDFQRQFDSGNKLRLKDGRSIKNARNLEGFVKTLDIKKIKNKMSKLTREVKAMVNDIKKIPMNDSDEQYFAKVLRMYIDYGREIKQCCDDNNPTKSIDLQKHLIKCFNELKRIWKKYQYKESAINYYEMTTEFDDLYLEEFENILYGLEQYFSEKESNYPLNKKDIADVKLVDEFIKLNKNNSLNESYIFNENNLEVDLDKWKIDVTNILFITGQSGSGKTTLGKQLAKENNALLVSVDFIECETPDKIDEWLKDEYDKKYKECECLPYIIRFYESFPHIKDNYNELFGNELKFNEVLIIFIRWIIKEVKNLDRLVIIEGTQMAFNIPYKEYENYPLIITGTSMLMSTFQRIKRSNNNYGYKVAIKNLLLFFRKYKMWIDDERTLNKLKDHIRGSKDLTLEYVDDVLEHHIIERSCDEMNKTEYLIEDVSDNPPSLDTNSEEENKSVPEDKVEKESMPKKVDKVESDKNGVRRKKLYIAFIEWAKAYNPKNTFGSVFDKDAFNVTYPFVPHEMRYFYRLANPMLCVLAGNLTFFAVAELKNLNMKNSRLSEMMIFAATDNDMRVFNNKDKKVYRGTEENGMLKLNEVLGDTFDIYLQKMINQGDILNSPLEESVEILASFNIDKG